MGSGHDSLTRNVSTTPITPQDSVTEPLEELRHLILGPEQAKLQQLRERLDNLKISPEDVSQVLPEAVLHRAHRDRQLATALLPVVEEAIQSSVRTHPRILVEALFPLMGPAIRRAVAHRLRSMLASLSQVLDVSISLRGLKWSGLVILLCGLGWWSVSAIRINQQWVSYLETLHAEPGIIVTTAEKRGSKYLIAGLRDPLAADPLQLLRDAHLSPLRVISRWQPYLALDPTFVLARAKTILEPPDTVPLLFEGDVLKATGSAPRPWIHEALRLARAILGIRSFDVEQVVDLTLRELLALKEAVEHYRLNFVKDTTHLLASQEMILDSLIVAVRKLFHVAQQASYEVRLHIIGHTDKAGSEGRNRPLSQERAERILAILTSHDIAKTHMRAEGVGSREPLREEIAEADRMQNRRVIVRVVLPEMSGR